MSEPSAQTEDVPALPGDGLREAILEQLRNRLGEGLIDSELRPQDDLWVRVATDAWAETGTALRDMGFAYFCFISAIDWMPSPYGRGEDNPDEAPPERTNEVVQGVTGGETRLQVFARVTDIARHVGVTVKVDVPDDDPQVASWHTIYAGANWHERETHEMFGIGFAGHPDLRNMYLPGEFEGHPLRKDFPLLARMVKPWPGIVDVEPMPIEELDGEPTDDDAVAGETAPESPTPDQTDAGVGEPPAEDTADEAAAATSTAEAPDSSQAPDAEESAAPAGETAPTEDVSATDAEEAAAPAGQAVPTEDEAPSAEEAAAPDAEVAPTDDEAPSADEQSGDDPAPTTDVATAIQTFAGAVDTPAEPEAAAAAEDDQRGEPAVES